MMHGELVPTSPFPQSRHCFRCSRSEELDLACQEGSPEEQPPGPACPQGPPAEVPELLGAELQCCGAVRVHSTSLEALALCLPRAAQLHFMDY